jgi:Na+/H+-dicarboxylate symporter/ABC-type amino acid transport substrate-binding protein
MNELTRTIPSGGEREKGKRGLSLPVRVLLGALLGVLLGLLVGDYTRVLEPVGKAYVQFLAMCVFPYLIASLLHGLGRMDPATAVRLFARSWFVFVLGWVTVLAAMMLLALAFPFSGKPAVILPANSGEAIDLVSILVPGNFFAALTRNYVPAVVVFAVLYGVAMQRVAKKTTYLEIMENIKTASVTIWNWVVKVSPIGVFALFAGTSGTLSHREITGLLLYVTTLTAGACILAFWVLPASVAAMTPLRYREIMRECRDGLVLSLATTLSVVALPAIIRAAHKFAQEAGFADENTADVVGTNVSLAYPFAQLGNLLVALFFLFCSSYYQAPLSPSGIALLPLLTLLSTIGTPTATVDAVNFLAGVYHTPAATEDLYVATSAFTRYAQVALSVMGFAFVTVLCTFSFYGRLRVRPLRLSLILASGFLAVWATVVAIRATGLGLQAGSNFPYMTFRLEPSLTRGVSAVIYASPEEAGEMDPAAPSVMTGIRRHGALRVGYCIGAMPFCHRNEVDQLVGYDVAFMYQLARDMNVKLEFIPYERHSVKETLLARKLDIAIGGLYVTPDRLRDLSVSRAYHQTPLAVLVRSELAKRLTTREKVLSETGLRLACVNGPGALEVTKSIFPGRKFTIVADPEEFARRQDLDLMVLTFTMASAFARSHPGVTAVVPKDFGSPVTMAYLMPPGSDQLQRYVDAWLDLKRADGFTARQERHWIDGIAPASNSRRWCVIRDYLHWVD